MTALYGHALGRFLLKLLTRPFISKAAGWFLSTKASCIFIKSFIRNHNIDISQYESAQYKSYNDFFCRKIRPELRPVDKNPHHLVSPCDSKLTVIPIADNTHFTLKHTPYTVASLIQNDALAREFSGGYALIFRLTVDDYHRYGYIDDGTREPFVKIPGVLHTVNPIANDYYPIYKANSREYAVLHTENFDDVLMMEVGALLVGRIVNHPETQFSRGQEKGYFRFGGSTVVLLIKENVVQIDSDILQNSADGIETVVKYGEKIATRI